MPQSIQSIDDLGSFEDVVAKSAPEIRKIAERLRSLVADVLPGVTEVCWPNLRIASYGVGPKKMSEHFVYIAPSSKHVNLGFYYGAEFLDARLEGTGKSLRHAKIHTLAEAGDPKLAELVRRASRHLPRLKKG